MFSLHAVFTAAVIAFIPTAAEVMKCDGFASHYGADDLHPKGGACVPLSSQHGFCGTLGLPATSATSCVARNDTLASFLDGVAANYTANGIEQIEKEQGASVNATCRAALAKLSCSMYVPSCNRSTSEVAAQVGVYGITIGAVCRCVCLEVCEQCPGQRDGHATCQDACSQSDWPVSKDPATCSGGALCT